MPSFRHNKRVLFFTGLIAITVLFSIYNLYLTEYSYFEATSRKTRHIIRFGTVLLAWGIGIFAYRRESPGWLLPIWHLLYVTIIFILLSIGIYDWWSGSVRTDLRNLAISLNEFLISPVPFVLIGLIRRLAGEQEPVSHPARGRLEKFR
ncbi:MAG TPA: hypothetical protein VK563_00550 [Puia sp.]|nr:hypothetical protein [Puia sp.]